MQRLREREIESRLTVSDAEVDHYLATLKAQNAGDSEYSLRTSWCSCPNRPARTRSKAGAAVRKRR